MPTFKTIQLLLRQLKSIHQSENLGLVPTMGALHNGHASLIKKAVLENKHVVVSVFVNPTQFNNKADLEKYPQTLDADIKLIHAISKDILIFTPSIKEMYQDNLDTKIYDFDGLDKVMEGSFRENHFNGVGTIVEQLFNLIKPTKAYFGEKDFQQLRVIQKLVKIKQLPVQIIGCPIVREMNGLAMSSRNERLDPLLRQKARIIYDSLNTAKQLFGIKSAQEVKDWVKERFDQQNSFELEYFEITDVKTLSPIIEKKDNVKYRGFIAVYADDIRLIDNIALN